MEFGNGFESEELLACGRALKNNASFLQDDRRRRRELAAPLITLGLEHTRRVRRVQPSQAEAWKISGQLELLRSSPQRDVIPRYRLPFDPVYDLPLIRATYDLLQAVRLGPDDFTTVTTLSHVYGARGMYEAALPYIEHIAGMDAINPTQMEVREKAQRQLAAVARSLGAEVPRRWENLNELEQAVSALLAAGRARSAAELLERAYPQASARTWELADRIATLRLHLGQAAQARSTWQGVATPPRPALQAARLAATYLIEGDLDAAREHYRRAIELEPTLFEALFGLALLEHDAGRATEAVSAADRAVQNAPSALASETAESLAKTARPFASTTGSKP